MSAYDDGQELVQSIGDAEPVVRMKSNVELMHDLMINFVKDQVRTIAEQEVRAESVWAEIEGKKNNFTNRELIDLYRTVVAQKNTNIAVLLENFKSEERNTLLDPSAEAIQKKDAIEDFYGRLTPQDRQALESIYQTLKPES